MLFIVGVVVVFLSVFGGYAAIGGRLDILWQPFEAVIICVATAGAYVIANPMPVLTRTMGAIIGIIKGPRYNKDNYIELLSMMYQLFRLAKTKGLLALETHIENPDESELFAQFPLFHGNHHVLLFLCDYLRMNSLSTDKPHEIEALMDEEIETHHHELHQVASAVQVMADGLPALGIVAAVLGIIKTMGLITEPPEILGHMIGGAWKVAYADFVTAMMAFFLVLWPLNSTTEVRSRAFPIISLPPSCRRARVAPAGCGRPRHLLARRHDEQSRNFPPNR